MTSVLPAPEPADPVEGQPGHFDHSNWVKASLKALDRALVPIGTIVAYSGSAALPTNWAICDGKNNTPDLQGKFILGASAARAAGTGGGAETVALTVETMPAHGHGGATGGVTRNATHQHSWGIYTPESQMQNYSGAGAASGMGTATNSVADTNHEHPIAAEGGQAPHENMPPYWALVYIMRVA